MGCLIHGPGGAVKLCIVFRGPQALVKTLVKNLAKNLVKNLPKNVIKNLVKIWPNSGHADHVLKTQV